MAPKMGEGGQIWLKCITGDLIMMIRDKNNIFERVENFHADLAWNYPEDLPKLSPTPTTRSIQITFSHRWQGSGTEVKLVKMKRIWAII